LDIVVDANILFSALIKDDHIRGLLLFIKHKIYVPEFILDEINKYKEEIIKRGNISEEEFKEVFNEILENSKINIVPKEDFESYIGKAREISPDLKDIHYFALALKLNCPICSDDKDFKRQDKVKILKTSEVDIY